MDINILGRILVGVGMGIALLGLVLVLFSRLPILKNFGKLPGDIHFQSGNFTCFAPIVSMILLSLMLSLILNVIARILR